MSIDKMIDMVEGAGGTVNKIVGPLPDGSGFATASLPLPEDHWIYGRDLDGHDTPPMPMRMGKSDPKRKEMEAMLRVAGRYALRRATMNGEDMDHDPDALIQNLIVGMLGYHTPDGLSGEDWLNPPEHRRR